MKVHLNLATRDLDASVAFFRTLLGSAPAKHVDDYALFLTEDPGLELALDADIRATAGNDAHYGLAVDSAAHVDASIARLRSAGYAVDIEKNETCCYAVQDKVWAADPDGRRWETYYVIEERDDRDGGKNGCCKVAAVGSAAADACC